MMELKVNLDFACCSCKLPVGVTVKCEGKDLWAGSRTVAAVNVPCPHCSKLNQLYFEPNGTVRAVAPCRSRPHEVEPSIN
jgi:hypothetical protein